MNRIVYLLFFITSFINAQNVLKVEYEEIINIDAVVPSNVPKEVKDQLLKNMNNNNKYFLFHSDGDTFYSNFAKLNEREIKKDVKEISEHRREVTTEIIPIVPTRIYHKKGEKGFYIYHKYLDEEYYEYTDPQWKSINYKQDVQRIDNFDCKLVDMTDQNGKVFHVWYTEQMPISVGPFNFNSLPGLVLKIEAPTYTLYATKVSNDAQPSDVETLDPKLKIYKGEELTKKKAEMNKPKVTRKVIRL